MLKWYAERLDRDELLKGKGKGKQVFIIVCIFVLMLIIIVSIVCVSIIIIIKVLEDPEEGFGLGDVHWTRRLKKENEELKKENEVLKTENEELKKQIVGDDPGDDYIVLCCTIMY